MPDIAGAIAGRRAARWTGAVGAAGRRLVTRRVTLELIDLALNQAS